MDKTFEEMRNFIALTGQLMSDDDDQPVYLEETASPSVAFVQDLHDVVFKLRAFMEAREGDLGLGIEMGMQQAADMIENVINRHTKDVCGG